MSWRLEISQAALDDNGQIPQPQADRILGALESFALTGYGDVRKVVGQDPPRWRLRIGENRALLTLDHAAWVVTVVRILPAKAA
jgi:mRNA interferase RelE/StbE